MQRVPDMDLFHTICKLLKLPPPEAADIVRLRGGFGLALEDYGCFVRQEIVLSDEKVPYPLAAASFLTLYRKEDVRSGIHPVFSCFGIAEEDLETLERIALDIFNLHLLADAADDCTYITRTPEEGFPNGIPILADVTDAVQLREYRKAEDWSLRVPKILEPFMRAQNACFGTLRECGNNIFIAEPGACREEQIDNFWHQLRAATTAQDEDGMPVLTAAWNNADLKKCKDPKARQQLADVYGAAQHYARRLRADDFHAPILEHAA
jgi:hypothetical protein